MVFWDLFIADGWHVRRTWHNSRFPHATVPFSRHSPLADHLHLTVTSSIASSLRKKTFLRMLSLATRHHVCHHHVFSFATADVEIVSSWGFLFAYEVMADIIARTLTATPPRYSTIKDLDRKIHEYAVSPETVDLIRGGPGVDPLSVPLPASMMAFMLATLHDVRKSLSLLHTIALRAKHKT
jgi:hypothetical protein